MKKITILTLALISSVYAATTFKVKEDLKKNFGKHETFKVRLLVSEEVICQHLGLCEKADKLIYSLISRVQIISKTYSDKHQKKLTLMSLSVSLNDLNRQCFVKMKLNPEHFIVSEEGDLEEVEESWGIRKITCQAL